MKVNDICIVKDTGRSIQHPEGTRVKVLHIVSEQAADDGRQYLCINEEGQTAYWYSDSDLELVEREGMI